MKREDYKTLSDEKLQEHFANTDHTGAMCSGHGKAEWNNRRNAMIKEEMDARGIAPDGRKGIFNGEGAY